jgi:hypothetical protein
MTLEVGVLAVGLLGPGLDDWIGGQALLRDPASWRRQPTVVPAPARLPATERRRAGTVVKASIVVADQALQAVGADPALLPTVFTSSTGDPLNCHLLCEALAAPARPVSPTRFTNSVHNAPAGYWHIATVSRQASTSLAAFDASFGAGLVEAAVQCLSTQGRILLVACDLPYPEPLHALRPVADVFALALLLAPAGGRRLRLAQAPETPPTRCENAGLEEVRRTIPAARALPLLQALAHTAPATLWLESLPGMSWVVEVAAA